MKYLLAALLLTSCFVPCFAQNTLHVTVGNVKSAEGNLAVAVFNSEGTFLEDDQQFRGKIVEIKEAGQVTVTIEDLPEGTYAVSVFHDENGNGELDKNLFGVPKEPYGFSNDAKGSLGPPSFEDAGFPVNQEEVTISITLQ